MGDTLMKGFSLSLGSFLTLEMLSHFPIFLFLFKVVIVLGSQKINIIIVGTENPQDGMKHSPNLP